MAKVSLIAKLQTDPEKAEEVEAALAATCSAANAASTSSAFSGSVCNFAISDTFAIHAI